MKKNIICFCAGFILLLILVLLAGTAGMRKINTFADKVRILGEVYFPRQHAVLNMKNINGLYVSAVRNHVSWKLEKYLDAALFSDSALSFESISEKIDENISQYVSLADSQQQLDWADELKQRYVRASMLAQKIVRTTNRSSAHGNLMDNKSKINLLVLTFENEIHAIDIFIENTLQRQCFADIDMHMNQAQRIRNESIRTMAFLISVDLLLGLLIAGYVIGYFIKSQRHREYLVQAMVRSEEKERQNLSFQVHNQMGQDLSALRIHLGVLERRIGPGKELEDCKSVIKNLLERMHNISDMLFPPELEDLGIEAMLENLVAQYKGFAEFDIQLLTGKCGDIIEPEKGLALYRVAQEALTNVTRHSKARQVKLTLESGNKSIVLSVSDDGCGFNTAVFGEMFKAYRKDGILHMGITSLKERIDILGGRLDVSSMPGHGTIVRVEFPL